MDLGPHAGFILAAYGATAIVVALVVLWVALDYRAQRQALATLEAEGTMRRSGGSSAT